MIGRQNIPLLDVVAVRPCSDPADLLIVDRLADLKVPIPTPFHLIKDAQHPISNNKNNK